MTTAQLVPDYRPSRPHGWPPASPGQTVGTTVGGHTTSGTFEHNERSYRIRLSAPDLTYATAPTPGFVRAIEDAFAGRYSFRYAGGLPAGEVLKVQSYSVTVTTGDQPAFGADLYLVHEGAHDPARVLRWIQVVSTSGTELGDRTYVDNSMRANPFLSTGGATSVDGRRTVNLYTSTVLVPQPEATDLAGRYSAEVFLVVDTGTQDGSGKASVVVLGGVRHGWEISA